jgi:hypothetical protein
MALFGFLSSLGAAVGAGQSFLGALGSLGGGGSVTAPFTAADVQTMWITANTSNLPVMAQLKAVWADTHKTHGEPFPTTSQGLYDAASGGSDHKVSTTAGRKMMQAVADAIQLTGGTLTAMGGGSAGGPAASSSSAANLLGGIGGTLTWVLLGAVVLVGIWYFFIHRKKR